jgi:hypothetical protein
MLMLMPPPPALSERPWLEPSSSRGGGGWVSDGDEPSRKSGRAGPGEGDEPVRLRPGGESEPEKESCSRVPMGDDEPVPSGGGKDSGTDGGDCERDDGGGTLGIFILRSDRIPSWARRLPPGTHSSCQSRCVVGGHCWGRCWTLHKRVGGCGNRNRCSSSIVKGID